ncbi:MAG: hypothetical protein KDB90_09235 [Planctomycetes bacterium]|nr:hypothetical protein [Planctomycetota bacterium]
MPIEFNCPFCGKHYRVADANANKRVKCKECGTPVTVPDTSGLSLEDTAQMRKLRNAPTEILPANRPTKSVSALPKGAIRKVNVPSDTAKISSAKPATRTAQRKPEPEPDVKLPGGKLPAGKLPGGLKAPPGLPKGATRIGKTRAIPEGPKTRRWNFVFMLGALALIVGFFLPWANIGLPQFEGSVAGFELGWRAADVAAAIRLEGLYPDNAIVEALHSTPNNALVMFALYLVPVLALYAIIDELRSAGKGKSHWWIRILAALSPLLALGVVYIALREPVDSFIASDGLSIGQYDTSAMIATLAPGAYTMLGGLLFALLGIVIAPKVKKPTTPASQPTGNQDDDDDMPDISPKTRPKLTTGKPQD